MKCSYAFLDRGTKLSSVILYLQDKKIIVTNGLQNFHKKFVTCPISTLEKFFIMYISEGAKSFQNMCSCPSPSLLTNFHFTPTLLLPYLSFSKVLTSYFKTPYRNNSSPLSSSRLFSS